MRKRLLIVSIILTLCLPLTLSGCFSKLASKTLNAVTIENAYDNLGEFDNININTLTADVSIRVSKTEKSSVECSELKNFEHKVNVIDNTLVIEQPQPSKWYEQAYTLTRSSIIIFVSENKFNNLTVTGKTGNVYIPSLLTFANASISVNSGNVEWKNATVENNLTIELKKGDVKIEGANLNLVQVEINSGDFDVSNCTVANKIVLNSADGNVLVSSCNLNSANVTVNTGHVSFTDVITTNQFFIHATTGNITLARFDASEIDVFVKYGNIKASFLSGKKVNAKAPEGNLTIPEDSDGQPCNLSTNSGTIEVEIIPTQE